MKYIDKEKIEELIRCAEKAPLADIDPILAKSMRLQRLSLGETAALFAARGEESEKKIFHAAEAVKNMIYGSRVVLFAPLYISNHCVNACLYCSFKSDNSAIERKMLSEKEIRDEALWLLSRGHKRVLMVAGEMAASKEEAVVDYYVAAMGAIYSASYGHHKVRRVNVNCAPLSTEGLRKLKAAGIGTYQLFQETYHEDTYRSVHPKGPKSDPDYRISAVDRAFGAGIDDVGVGVLYGLYDYRFETLALLSHIEALEEKFGVGPHTISVPRVEPAVGVDFSAYHKYAVSDGQFKRLVAILRLAVPYTGLILSTRETPAMRDELFNLGVSQVSAESRTSPGGYVLSGEHGENNTQFILNDHRTLEEVAGSLIEKGFIPSFCAACYRSSRTGEAFMNLAKPGTIKGKCQTNALITLKEYLDDFASDSVKKKGYGLIRDVRQGMDVTASRELSVFFEGIEKGSRDGYV